MMFGSMTRLTGPLALATAASLLCSCAAVGPNYQAPTTADLSVPQRYHGGLPGQLPADAETWWHRFGDAELDKLVAQAISANPDMAVARARLRQARESVVQSRASLFPQVGVSATTTENADSEGNTQTSFSLNADASWEADIFGGVRRSVEAARAGEQESEYDLASTRVALIGDVVNYYVQARLAQTRAALASQSLSVDDDNLQIARWRLQAGLVSTIDVEQARGQRAQTAATIPTYQKDFSSAAFRLGILTGQAPGSLVAELSAAAGLPETPAVLAAGLPADTLRQRPDVRSAERSLAAEVARIGVAEADLYPKLQLGGTIGSTALTVGGLIDAVTGNLFATLSKTIFDAGKTRSQVRSQKAAADAAFSTYKKTVLSALEDVENGLAAQHAAEQRQSDFAEALDAAKNQELLARTEYRSGLTDFQTLLEAERSLLSANQGLVTSRADRILAIVQLYRAMGGGWNPQNPTNEG